MMSVLQGGNAPGTIRGRGLAPPWQEMFTQNATRASKKNVTQ